MFHIRPGKSGSGSRMNRGAMICDPDGRVTGMRVCAVVEARFMEKMFHAETAEGWIPDVFALFAC